MGFGSLAAAAPPASTGGVLVLWQEANSESTTPPSPSINITHKPGKNRPALPGGYYEEHFTRQGLAKADRKYDRYGR